ncbi:hypothetical protein [Oleiharenicola lentus]|uniref:hypothetical protein n=1 Tax=Oleiharenicola lentus TaxID=2508720 RepID=UPI003F67F7DA
MAGLLFVSRGNAEGYLLREEGHYSGVLDFFNNEPNLRNRVTHPNPAVNGFQGNGDGWVGTEEIRVKGLMRSARLSVDWWTLFDEPVANYFFYWESSGGYSIQYRDPAKGWISADIDRNRLMKHPLLARRFDALKPESVAFEILWNIGNQGDAEREAFKKQFRIFGSIGGSAPFTKTAMRTPVISGQLITEPSGKKPFAVPSSPPGGWKTFGTRKDTLTDKEKRMLAAYFNLADNQTVRDFKATQVTWPLVTMKQIAVDFARAEAGERPLSPTETADRATQPPLSAYRQTDTWAEPSAAPRPPVPPIPYRRTADNLAYFYRPDGTKAFPQGFIHADPFDSKEKLSSKLTRVVTHATPQWHYNYLDREGRLQFDTSRTILEEISPDLFEIGDRALVGRYGKRVADRRGLYDRRSKRYLIPEQLLTAVGIRSESPGPGKIAVRATRIARIGQPYVGRDTFVNRQVNLVEVSFEFIDYELDLNTRQIREISRETTPYRSTAASNILGIPHEV